MKTKKRVLVIDDELGVVRFVKINLALAGYDVTTALNGEDGLKLVKLEKPDIILLDILMEPMTGFDVLVKLREFSKMPVIVFAARNDIGNLAIAEGANGFIAKPFKPDELKRKIQAILNRKGD